MLARDDEKKEESGEGLQTARQASIKKKKKHQTPVSNFDPRRLSTAAAHRRPTKIRQERSRSHGRQTTTTTTTTTEVRT